MKTLNPLRVGLLGFGVVGSGTWNVLKRNADEISRRAGREIIITRIATRTPAKAMQVVDADVKVDDDLDGLIADPHIDVVVEVIGGCGRALDLVLAAIRHGKHVVTANKALLAEHGDQIFPLASQHGVMVAYEAAVAGGIPIIKAIREGMSANRIQWLAGIINGTSNFILTQMRCRGLSFPDALKEAQEKGYAEADPTFDVQGIDAAHKLTLMAAIAFGSRVRFEQVHIEGIAQISPLDVHFADKLGYRIKHLGIARKRPEGLELRVHPTLLPCSKLLASVEHAMNAVLIHGDAVGETLAYGPGAGSQETASAVIADLVDVARLHSSDPQHRVPHLAFQADALADYPILSISDTFSAYYLRLLVQDSPGVLADITRIFADQRISIESMVQEEPDSDGRTHIVLLTHEVREGNLDSALAQIEALDCVHDQAVKLRLERLP